MNKIEIEILNPEAIENCEKMMVCCARLTQRGHNITNMTDFKELYNKPYTDNTVKSLINLPHPTIQKFGVINIAIIGASRRFLAQITRHQNEVKFMSASLQYSDYSNNNSDDNFVVPYNILVKGDARVADYLDTCKKAMIKYKEAVESGIDNDSAGYLAPQSLRNILIISATPYQWKHMIAQRSCKRNTDEMRYVMLRIWEKLYDINQTLFENCGPWCLTEGRCKEGKMCCKKPMKHFLFSPGELWFDDYPNVLYK